MQKAVALRAQVQERIKTGDTRFSDSLELMTFLANLIGSEHIERFIPLADPANERALELRSGCRGDRARTATTRDARDDRHERHDRPKRHDGHHRHARNAAIRGGQTARGGTGRHRTSRPHRAQTGRCQAGAPSRAQTLRQAPRAGKTSRQAGRATRLTPMPRTPGRRRARAGHRRCGATGAMGAQVVRARRAHRAHGRSAAVGRGETDTEGQQDGHRKEGRAQLTDEADGILRAERRPAAARVTHARGKNLWNLLRSNALKGGHDHDEKPLQTLWRDTCRGRPYLLGVARRSARLSWAPTAPANPPPCA